jgi:hypothetical protein
MVAVRMVKVAGDPIVHMIAVRDRLVAAAGTMHVARLMTAAAMVRSAAVGVFGRHLDHVLIDMVFMRVMEVTVMQVVGMAVVLDGGMAAARSVAVSVVGMGRGGTGGHGGRVLYVQGSADTSGTADRAASVHLGVVAAIDVVMDMGPLLK